MGVGCEAVFFGGVRKKFQVLHPPFHIPVYAPANMNTNLIHISDPMYVSI